MTDAEAFMYAALIWPSDRVLQVQELADADGDWDGAARQRQIGRPHSRRERNTLLP